MPAAARRSVVPADDPPTTEDAAALQGGGSTSGFRQQLNAYIRLIHMYRHTSRSAFTRGPWNGVFTVGMSLDVAGFSNTNRHRHVASLRAGLMLMMCRAGLA